jgi:hypothetical protein
LAPAGSARDPTFALARHIDTDETNATNVQTGAQAYNEDIQNER